MADVLPVIGKIRAPKGKGDALAALLKEQVAAVRKMEPGCLVYRYHRSTQDLYEQFKDDAARDLHRKSPHLAAYRERWTTVAPVMDFSPQKYRSRPPR